MLSLFYFILNSMVSGMVNQVVKSRLTLEIPGSIYHVSKVKNSANLTPVN